MKIVTFCSHQPYLHLFHKSSHRLDLIQIPKAKRFLQNWDQKVRPLPENWQIIDLDQAKQKRNQYQVAIAHNINDYLDLLPLKLPIVLVIHTSLSSRFAEESAQTDKDEYRKKFDQIIRQTGGLICFVTPGKKRDWQLPGKVIVAGIDPDDYLTYTGEMPRLLRVSNHLRRRGRILGYRLHKQLSKGWPLDLVGENPAPSYGIARSWDELKMLYQTRRAFVHTANPDFEDGFNLAVIEAMASGMPVVSTSNPSSPVHDGVNGFKKSNIQALRENIGALMADVNYAQKLGEVALETVKEKFHFTRFNEEWDELLTQAQNH